MQFNHITEIEIDWNKWIKGYHHDGVLVSLKGNARNEYDPHYDILGKECLLRGIAESFLDGFGYLEEVIKKIRCGDIPDMTKNGQPTELVNQCMTTNDNPDIDDKTRMHELIKLYRQRGLSLRFINVPTEHDGPVVE